VCDVRHAEFDRRTLGLCALLLVGLVGACFSGDATRGLPCDDDRSCGPELACEQGFCGGEPRADDAGDSTGEPTVAISGTLRKVYFDGGAALVGVEISLADDPDIRDVTDDLGAFRLEGVPAGTPAYLVAAPSAQYYGSIVGVDVRYVDVEEVALAQASQLYIEGVVQALQMQDPLVDIDPDLGVVVASANAVDVTTQLAPRTPGSRSFAPDAMGMPVLDAELIAYIWLPMVVYFNLDIGETGTFEITADHATKTCTSLLATPATRPRHLSIAEITCN